MNKPYLKEYNEKKEWTNPIKGNYIHSEENRQQRRSELKKLKQHNNRAETLGRVTQRTMCGKTIRHETNSALKRKIALFNFMQRIELLKLKWHKAHPKYQKSQK